MKRHVYEHHVEFCFICKSKHDQLKTRFIRDSYCKMKKLSSSFLWLLLSNRATNLYVECPKCYGAPLGRSRN